MLACTMSTFTSNSLVDTLYSCSRELNCKRQQGRMQHIFLPVYKVMHVRNYAITWLYCCKIYVRFENNVVKLMYSFQLLKLSTFSKFNFNIYSYLRPQQVCTPALLWLGNTISQFFPLFLCFFFFEGEGRGCLNCIKHLTGRVYM